MDNEPSHASSDTRLRQLVANLCIGFNHAVDEDTENGRDHDETLEPEELAELVGPEEAESQMDAPEQEKGQHSVGLDSGRCGELVGDVLEAVAENGSEHVAHVAGAGVHCRFCQFCVLSTDGCKFGKLTLDAVPDGGQNRTSSDIVVTAIHSEDHTADGRISKMVRSCSVRVEGHGNGTDHLRDENDNEGLPPVQADSDHGLRVLSANNSLVFQGQRIERTEPRLQLPNARPNQKTE